jgi:hypothetical protein
MNFKIVIRCRAALFGLLLGLAPLAALELTLVHSFSTEGFSSAPAASITVDPEKDVLLMGTDDGGIAEVALDGEFRGWLIAPGTIADWGFATQAIAVAAPLGRIFAVGTHHNPLGPLDRSMSYSSYYGFSREGDFLGGSRFFGSWAGYSGFCYEPDQAGGPGTLHVYLMPSNYFMSYGFQQGWPVELAQRVSLVVGWGSGIAYLRRGGEFLFLVSRRDGKLVAATKAEPISGGRHLSRRVGETLLTRFGLATVEDIAIDQRTELLYAIDPETRKVYVFSIGAIGPVFRRGDANADGLGDMGDVLELLQHLFQGPVALPCLEAADADNSGRIDITDPLYLIQYLFLGGPPPPHPGPAPREFGGFTQGCGSDPDPRGSAGFLGCELYEAC